MEKLLNRSSVLVNAVDTTFVRNPGDKIKWDWRLTGIFGARGVGKTTLFLDYFSDLFLFFTGSSAVEILKQDVDLSRRALVYELSGLSFREYLMLQVAQPFEAISLSDIIQHHREIALDLTQYIRPLQYFKQYLT